MAAEYQYIPIVYKQKKAVSNRYANNRQAIYAQIDQYHAVKKANVKKSAVKSKPVKSVKTKVKKPAKARNGRSAFVAVVAAAGLSNPTYAEPVVTAVDRTLERPEKKEKVKIKVRKGVISTILLVAFVLAMLVLVLAGNSMVSSVNFQNAKISSDIAAIKEEIRDVQLDISFAENLENIQTRATVLGLGTPRANQIVYLNGSDMGLSQLETETAQSDEASFVINDEID